MSGSIDSIPQRHNEYRTIKIYDYDSDIDNYIEGNIIIFNKYKSSDIYGPQLVIIPKSLYKYVEILMKLNKGQYLFSISHNLLSSSNFTKLVQQILEPHIIGTNQLRSIF
jgi:hypothetical protein